MIPDYLNSQKEVKEFAEKIIETCIPDGLLPQQAIEKGIQHIPWNRLHKDVAAIVQKEVQKRQVANSRKDGALREENKDELFATPKLCICDGSGWISSFVPTTHINFGRVVPCSCLANKNNLREYLWKLSGIDQGMAHTFASYNRRNKECGTALDLAVKWSGGEDKKWLLLLGNVGTGKSHLARASAFAIIGRNEMCHYTTAAEISTQARTGIGNGSVNEYVQFIKTVKYLIFDDLGREYTTDYIKSLFYEIIDYRYARRLHTMITSNFTFTELEDALDKAVVDRFQDIILCDIATLGKTTSMRSKDRKEDYPW